MLQEESDLSLVIAQIVQKLKGSNLYAQLERQAWASLQRPEIKLESLKEDIKEFFKLSGWEKKLQNAVYSELNVFPLPSHPAAPPEHLKEPLVYMRKAQGSWEKRILKSLNSMCTELSIPLARKRPVGEQKELLNKWNEMGTDEPDLSLFRPVYAPKDFLEVLINLRNPNYENGDSLSFRTHLGLIQVPLKVKGIPELKEFFVELGLTTGQLGIDDSTQVPPELFENEHVRIGQKVLAEQDSAAAQQYIRQGSPTALRAELWALILNISSQPEDILYYEQLKTNVIQHDLLVDSLIYKDVKLTASNDDYYFVFEDYLYQGVCRESTKLAISSHLVAGRKKIVTLSYNYKSFLVVVKGTCPVTKLPPSVKRIRKDCQFIDVFRRCPLFHVLLCFSRDTSVLGHFAYNSASPPKSYIRGKLGLEEYAVFYPPNVSGKQKTLKLVKKPTTGRSLYVQCSLDLTDVSAFTLDIIVKRGVLELDDISEPVLVPLQGEQLTKAQQGVIPFHGFSMYVAPLCFLYHEPSKLYQIFREMYVRFFFRLHSISSHPSGIVSLCLLFETLLQTYLPQLFYHLREIGAQPLRISFKWMVRAFSGYLATDQLLLLWDRILGYNSLEILAVLAAAVFAFRAVNLMEVTSLAAAEAVLADLSTLKVMPLLQIFLFATVT